MSNWGFSEHLQAPEASSLDVSFGHRGSTSLKKDKKKVRHRKSAAIDEESSAQAAEPIPEEVAPAPMPAFEEFLVNEPAPMEAPAVDHENMVDEGSAASDTKSVASEPMSLPQINPRQGQYQSEVFTIRVGPKKEAFTAHRDVLAKSPKLDKQCNGRFMEAKKKRLDLAHDPKIFALLLEFLYTGDYWPCKGDEFEKYRSEDEDVRAIQLQREGDLYCLAEYNDLPDLQELAVHKMKLLTPITFESFLSVSDYIYNNSGDTGPFRPYFRNQIEKTLPQVVHESWMLDAVAKGGDLAQDLFLSCRRAKIIYHEDGCDEPAVKVEWKHDQI